MKLFIFVCIFIAYRIRIIFFRRYCFAVRYSSPLVFFISLSFFYSFHVTRQQKKIPSWIAFVDDGPISIRIRHFTRFFIFFFSPVLTRRVDCHNRIIFSRPRGTTVPRTNERNENKPKNQILFLPPEKKNRFFSCLVTVIISIFFFFFSISFRCCHVAFGTSIHHPRRIIIIIFFFIRFLLFKLAFGFSCDFRHPKQ